MGLIRVSVKQLRKWIKILVICVLQGELKIMWSRHGWFNVCYDILPVCHFMLLHFSDSFQSLSLSQPLWGLRRGSETKLFYQQDRRKIFVFLSWENHSAPIQLQHSSPPNLRQIRTISTRERSPLGIHLSQWEPWVLRVFSRKNMAIPSQPSLSVCKIYGFNFTYEKYFHCLKWQLLYIPLTKHISALKILYCRYTPYTQVRATLHFMRLSGFDPPG